MSRPRGSFSATEHGEAVAPLPEEGAGECEVDAAPHTKPCYDKCLLPEGGFCHVPWKGGTVVSVITLVRVVPARWAHWFAVCGSLAWFQLPGALHERAGALQSERGRGGDVRRSRSPVSVLETVFPPPRTMVSVSLKGNGGRRCCSGARCFPREHAQQPEQQPDAHPELFPSRLTVEQSLLSNDIVSILST